MRKHTEIRRHTIRNSTYIHGVQTLLSPHHVHSPGLDRSISLARSLRPSHRTRALTLYLTMCLDFSDYRVNLHGLSHRSSTAIAPAVLVQRDPRDRDVFLRLPPVHQAKSERSSRERLGSHGVGWRCEENRVCRPNGAGVAYRCAPPRYGLVVVEEVVDISMQPCQAKQKAQLM